MPNLQVEELEARQLLSASGFSPPSPSWQSSMPGGCTPRAAEGTPAVESGGSRADGVSQAGSGARTQTGTAATNGRAITVVVPAATAGPAAVSPAAPAAGSASPAPAGGAGSRETAAANPIPVPAAPADAETTRAASAETVVERPNAPAVTRVANPAAPPGTRADVPALAGARLAIREGGAGEGPLAVPGPFGRELPLPPGSGPSGGQGPAPPSGRDAEQLDEAQHRAGVQTALPAADLSAVELGLRQFLRQLERAGQALGLPGDGTGLWPWVVAGAAAGAACEIARRELRRPAGPGNRGPLAGPEDLAAG
jgi:hypothetical protein